MQEFILYYICSKDDWGERFFEGVVHWVKTFGWVVYQSLVVYLLVLK